MGGAKWGAGLAVAAFLLVTASAGAYTAGGACVATVEHCERWSATIQGPPLPSGYRPDEFPAAVAVSGTTVYAAVKAVGFDTNDPYASSASWTIAARDLATGAERWRVFRQSRAYDSIHDLAVSPDGRTVVATGGAYDGFPVGATDSHVVTAAFDAATGAERWSAVWDGRPDATDNGNDVAFSPDGSKVFIGGITTGATNGDLNYLTLAYDVRKGKQLWARVYSGLNTGGSDAQYGLAVSPGGDKVYVTGESAGAREYDIDYATVAYDARTGRQLWVSRQDRGGADRAGAIAVDAGHVFVTGDSYTGPNGADYDAYTVALSPKDGHVLWQAILGGPGYDDGRALVAGGGRVIVTTQSPGATPADGLDAITAAYDATTGHELWRTRLAETGRGELANDLALAPGGGVAYLVASTHPTIPYTALDEQEVLALRTADGSTAWNTNLDAGPDNALTGDAVAVSPDGSSVVTLGQITRSADPLGPRDQNIYDSLLAVFGG